MPRVLVTGASGFVGRQTLKPLLERGFEVHGVSRTLSSSDDDIAWHKLDLLTQSAAPLLAAVRPSHLLHCAWTTEHGVYWASPDNAAWLAASRALVTDFADCGGRDIVGVGSCAEYDWHRQDAAPWLESDPCQPATVYGQAKLEFSQWLERFAVERGLRQAWARLFFLFGEGEDARRLIAYLVHCAKSGDVARCSSGFQVRDFLDSVTCGDDLAAVTASQIEGAVNIGSGRGRSVRDLAALIDGISDRGLVCDFGALPDRPDDPSHIVADVTRLRTVTGKRQDGLIDALTRMVAKTA